jgi:hypothetical protein
MQEMATAAYPGASHQALGIYFQPNESMNRFGMRRKIPDAIYTG